MFDGNPIQLKSWWQELARDSESLPLLHIKPELLQNLPLLQRLLIK
jgi:hypothetical protein